jgi:hypothetical protein
LAATILIGLVVPPSASAACGHEGVSITGTADEAGDACRALAEVLRYFEKIGLRAEPIVSISFQDQVYIDMFPQTYEPANRDSVGRNRVSGYYDFRSKELQVTSGRHDLHRERKPWGIEWGQPIAYSILQHELTHAIVANILGSEYPKFAKAWLEFIAYSVQFDLMERELKRKVLANYPDTRPFQFPENVNAVVYAADPDEFGVAAHLFTEANGGAAFVREIVTKEAPFSIREFEFLWVE